MEKGGSNPTTKSSWRLIVDICGTIEQTTKYQQKQTHWNIHEVPLHVESVKGKIIISVKFIYCTILIY